MLDGGLDQATGLRGLFGRPGMRVLGVADGQGNGGSPAFVLNLAAALARTGWHPVVLDGRRDGLSGLLGLGGRGELADLLRADRPFESAASRCSEGFSVLPARQGLAALATDLDAAEATFSALAALPERFDIALVCAPDATLGALLGHTGGEAAMLCGTSDEALMAAYARVKLLATRHRMSRFRMVFDGGAAPGDVARHHRRLASVAERYLSAAIEYGGAFGDDGSVSMAASMRASVFAVSEQGRAARAFERIASAAREWQLPAYHPAGATLH